MTLEITSPTGDKLGTCLFDWQTACGTPSGTYQIVYQDGAMWARPKEDAKYDRKPPPISPTPVVCPPCGIYCDYTGDKEWLFEMYVIPEIFARWFDRYGIPYFWSVPLVLKEFNVKTSGGTAASGYSDYKTSINGKECCCNSDPPRVIEIDFGKITKSTRALLPHNYLSVGVGDPKTVCSCGVMSISNIASCNWQMAETIQRMREEELKKCKPPGDGGGDDGGGDDGGVGDGGIIGPPGDGGDDGGVGDGGIIDPPDDGGVGDGGVVGDPPTSGPCDGTNLCDVGGGACCPCGWSLVGGVCCPPGICGDGGGVGDGGVGDGGVGDGGGDDGGGVGDGGGDDGGGDDGGVGDGGGGVGDGDGDGGSGSGSGSGS